LAFQISFISILLISDNNHRYFGAGLPPKAQAKLTHLLTLIHLQYDMRPKIAKKAPGERLVKRMPLRTKWILCAAAGILLFGFGLSVVATVHSKRHE
jgi:hypothetical protein